MTKEEREQLHRIKAARGRFDQQAAEDAPKYKDDTKIRRFAFRVFGRLVEIKVHNPNK